MRYLLQDDFIASVKRFPDNTAIFVEGGKHVTYKELNRLSNRFSNYIKSQKSEAGDTPFVGILSSVHISSIAAVLGTLKIGCAYIPLDEYSPTERLMNILNTTQLDILFIDPLLYEEHKELLTAPTLKKMVLLDQSTQIREDRVDTFQSVLDSLDTEPSMSNQVSDDLAYILHSSGSTGIPKGIMLTHRNARTFVDWMQKEFKLTQDDVVMSRAPFKFDLSVFDIFNTLKVGAKLVCYDWTNKRDDESKHREYVSLMEQQKATILYTTPSTFIVLLNKGGLGKAELHLREIMYAGEPFPTPQLRKLQEALPHTRIANIYGPTETNIITYYWIDTIPEDDSPIPLGYVVEDTEILVVSEDGKRICDVEELGELWCRGGTVTLGYLGMPDKTSQLLVQSPFHMYPATFCRTGDFGFRDKEGLLHYKGRKDHMVKVLGFRIELGEIENALAQNSSLDEFAVVAVPDEKYGNKLYCYYSVIKGSSVQKNVLKEFLSSKIPNYMIPFAFIEKKIMPKTSSGKIDRVLLAHEV